MSNRSALFFEMPLDEGVIDTFSLMGKSKLLCSEMFQIPNGMKPSFPSRLVAHGSPSFWDPATRSTA